MNKQAVKPINRLAVLLIQIIQRQAPHVSYVSEQLGTVYIRFSA